MAANWENVKRLFQECLELEPGERDAFLDMECEGDVELRDEVMALLAADIEAGNLMGAARSTGSTVDAPDAQAGTHLFNERPHSSEASLVCPHCHESFNTGELVCPHDGEVLVVDPDLLVDTTIDGLYKVLKYLGGGGFGHVYLARHVLLRDLVAIKVLPRALSFEQERLERFLREGRAARALHHANLVRVHDLRASADGLTYMVMEFVDGRTLREECEQRGKLAPKEIVELLGPIASALDEAHAHGVVHRDIKPENIMFGESGGKPVVKLLDLGIAKLREIMAEPLGEGENVTRPGQFIGTPRYMSPEQWGDYPNDGGPEIDGRADVYSLGVVIYEMITGQAPFHGRSNSEIRRAHLAVMPPPLHTVEPTVPVAFSDAVTRALAKSRSDRPASAGVLLEELRRAVTGERSGVDTVVDKIDPPAKRRSRAAILTMAIAAGLAIAIGWWLFHPKQPPKPPIVKTRKVTFTGNAVAAAISPDGEHVVAAIEKQGKQGLYLYRTDGGANVPMMDATDGRISHITYTHDGKFIYFCLSKHVGGAALYRLPVPGGTPQPILSAVDSGVAISPADDRLAFIRIDTAGKFAELVLVNSDGSGEKSLARSEAPQMFAPETPAWSPDGHSIACAISDSSSDYRSGIAEVLLADASVRLVTPLRWWYVDSVAWVASGRELVASVTSKALGELELWRVTYPDGASEQIPIGVDSYQGVTVASNGTISAVAVGIQQRLWVSRAPNGSDAKPITEGDDRFFGASWTPDGRILYSSRQSGNSEIYLTDDKGKNMTQLTFDPAVDRDPVMAPDRQTVFFVSNRSGAFHIWRVNSDEPAGPVQVTSGSDEEFPAVTPDGNWLVFQGDVPQNAASTIWKMRILGAEPVSISGLDANWPAVSPDGKWIACTEQPGDEDHVKGSIISTEGTSVPRAFEVPVLSMPRYNFQRLRWSGDSRDVLYIDDIDGVSQIWSLTLATGNRRPLTSFASDRIFTFDARDGELVLVRGSVASNVVVVTVSSSEPAR